MRVLIEGMTCDRCVRRVATAIRSVAGVTRVNLDPISGVAEIAGATDATRIALAVAATGYRVVKERPPTQTPDG